MPELPEVETVRRLLEKTVVGKKIVGVDVYREANIETDHASFVSSLTGKTIQSVLRKGKLLGFRLDEGLVLTAHLRMEGKFFYQPRIEEQKKHDILRLFFESGDCLVYNDTRKFGRLGLYASSKDALPLPFHKLGPEPFEYNAVALCKALSRQSRPIKECLMDQSIISGIGNIYADETLFASSIHPLTKASLITEAQCETILTECCRILNEAISSGGSTVKTYHPGNGIDGLMQVHLKAYGKEGIPCLRCGFPLHRIIVNGRGTTYCPICQKSPQKPFVLGITGPIHSGKSTVSALLEEHGYLHFDADKVAKESYFDRACKKKIRALLGAKSYVAGGPDFDFIRSTLAANPQKKAKLETIIHPYVFSRAEELIRSLGPDAKLILDVPLLFQSGMDGLCDATLLVIADLNKRIARIEKEGRDAKSLAKINASYPLNAAMKKASFILGNDAGIDELKAKLFELPLP
ncbi:MAG: DNA-formamidopyrimidine glycosylase [Bacilli bacterium]|nr:DNA-formamidopyrimidine glycosylase [Bacilli bacterium]